MLATLRCARSHSDGEEDLPGPTNTQKPILEHTTHSKNEPSRVGSGSMRCTRVIIVVSSSIGWFTAWNARLGGERPRAPGY